MKLPFFGQAYQSRAPMQASQTAVNIFPELSEGQSDVIGAFYGTPGLAIEAAPNYGEVRGLHTAGGSLYAVVGSTVYRLGTSFDETNLGDLPNSTGRVSFTHNETQVAIAHQDGWHWVAFTGSAIAPVANSPPNSILTFQDVYVLYTAGGGQFGVSALADLSSLNALDIATAESQPDNLVAVISDHRDGWLFGEETTEIWSDSGGALFPFSPITGAFMQQGIASPFGLCQADNSIFWLGKDRNGQGIFFRTNGYTPMRVSTHPIETVWSEYSTISDAIVWAQQDSGHTFIWVTFPSADATWVYDVAANGWHRRAWMDAAGSIHRHRANCYAFFNGEHIVGDFQNGSIYRMAMDLYTDAGDLIYRERAFDLPDSQSKRVRVDLFELMATLGDGASTFVPSGWTMDETWPTFDSTYLTMDGAALPNISAPATWLEVSRDAGRNFGYKRITSAGALGKTMARWRWRRPGNGRNIVLKVCTTMRNRVQWVGARMDGEELAA